MDVKAGAEATVQMVVEVHANLIVRETVLAVVQGHVPEHAANLVM